MDQVYTRYTTTLLNRTHEYGDVYTFTFEKPRELTFASGNYAHIFLPTVQAPDKSTRKLSFASAPNDKELVFSTITASHSPWKTKLLELKNGDTVEIFKIKGYLEIPKSGTLVMIANGVGITPFRSIIREHFKESTPITPIFVHFGKDHYLYENEFSQLDFEQYRITREQTEEILNPIIERYKNAMYVVSGSPLFVENMTKTLQEKGIPENQIQTDSFDGLID